MVTTPTCLNYADKPFTPIIRELFIIPVPKTHRTVGGMTEVERRIKMCEKINKCSVSWPTATPWHYVGSVIRYTRSNCNYRT